MEFQYDDDGNTSIVFFLTVILLYLVSSTYSRLTRTKEKDADDFSGLTSLCRSKDAKIEARKAEQKTFWSTIPWGDIIYVLAWICFFILAYKVSQFETTEGYDPYKILGISTGSTDKEIKKAYRQLSRLTHPDRNPDNPDAADNFMRIRKAYEALTDEETRENLEEFGSPEGRQQLSFGIALPAWLVAKDNAMYVLLVYGFIFMVAMPIAIGSWWYRRNYSFSEDVLNDTKVILWRYMQDNARYSTLVELLSWCAEYQQLSSREQEETYLTKKLHNSIGDLPKLAKWRFLAPKKIGLGWEAKPASCVKARYLMLGHLHRSFEEHPLLPSLEDDYYFVLRRIPVLIDAMIEIRQERSQRIPIPSLPPMLAIMHMHQQFIQAFSSPRADPLLQIPHIDERTIKLIKGRKIRLTTIREFYSMSAAARAKVLKDFTPTELEDIENFGALYPALSVDYRIKVGQDDTVTTGSIVTLTAELERKPVNTLEMSPEAEAKLLQRLEKGNAPEKEETAEDREAAAEAYLKSKKTKGKPSRKKKKAGAAAAAEAGPAVGNGSDGEEGDADDNDGTTAANGDAKPEDVDDDEDPGEVVPNDMPLADTDMGGKKSDSDDSDDDDDNQDSDDDFDWEANDEEIRIERERQKRAKEQALRPKDSHPVHCPLFPDPKQEFWWVFLADDTSQRMITPARKVTNLKEKDEVDIVFAAPPRAGTYKFQLYVVSDSYIGPMGPGMTADYVKQVKLTVEQGAVVEEEEVDTDDDIESEDSEQEFMLSEDEDEDDF
mmetsp:Transcript_35776/g.93601  ORF Transcript_35776/g.93601 Transcript_35776/m.93601 type:complete len:775 (+) Transcript_35776:95-2419(+)